MSIGKEEARISIKLLSLRELLLTTGCTLQGGPLGQKTTLAKVLVGQGTTPDEG